MIARVSLSSCLVAIVCTYSSCDMQRCCQTCQTLVKLLKYKQETVGEVAAEKVKDQSATKDMDPENEGWILVRRRGSGKGTKTKQGEVHSKEIT